MPHRERLLLALQARPFAVATEKPGFWGQGGALGFAAWSQMGLEKGQYLQHKGKPQLCPPNPDRGCEVTNPAQLLGTGFPKGGLSSKEPREPSQASPHHHLIFYIFFSLSRCEDRAFVSFPPAPKREEGFEKNIKFRKGAQKGWEQVFLSHIRAACPTFPSSRRILCLDFFTFFFSSVVTPGIISY